MVKNIKLRSVSFVLLIIAMLVFGALKITGPAKAINTPWLTTSGRFIKDPSGNTVILRGVSLVDLGVASSKRTKNAIALTNMAIDATAGWYARVVRLPVYPDAIDGTPGWNANPDAYYNNLLKPATDNCVAKQIYCIIDWHYISDYTSAAIDTSTRNFWSYVAPKYANTPNIIFELYNEPIAPNNWSTWKATAQPWVNVIRAAAPNNLILVGGPNWSQTVAEAATNPFSGGNIVYVCHIYPQHGGQSTWDSWFGNSSATVPYFLTEFGWRNGGGAPTSGTTSGFGAAFMNYLETKGVSWTAWVFDTIWDPYIFDSNWNLLIGDGYMGQTIKDELAQHQNDNLPGGGGTNPTNTPIVAATATRTNTPVTGATNTPTSGGALKVQLSGGGTDNTQQTAFNLQVMNTGSSAASNISARIYFTTENSNAASGYVLEKYYDQSGVSTVSGPTLASGSTYYYTVNFGTASLPAGGAWAYNTAMHLSSWASTYSATNDFWHGTGTLPPSFTNWSSIPLYVNGSLIWGSEPGGVVSPTATRTNTPVSATNTPVVGPTNTPVPATRTNTPVSATNTPVVPTSTPVSGSTCSPVSATITAPFVKDGAGTFCWQISSIPGYVNSWNTTSVSINGVNATNLYLGAGSLPAKIGGYYYISYNSSVGWAHFEAK